jgi:hypothetical protein
VPKWHEIKTKNAQYIERTQKQKSRHKVLLNKSALNQTGGRFSFISIKLALE